MINGRYLYETHMHTAEASKCSDTPAREYIARYQDLGYDGLIITDHFYGGNTCVDRSLPWPEFVRRFSAGYEHAREEGEKRGMQVFFGWEENFAGDEYLIYGLEPAFMLAHPEMPRWTRREQYEAVRAAGGCVVQAHPFRARDYISTIWLSPYFCDAAEGVNTANEDRWNTLALRYAASLGLPVTCGSDNHHADRMRPYIMGGMLLDTPLTSGRDYARMLLDREPMAMHLPHPVPEYTPDMVPEKPLYWLEWDGTKIPEKTVKGTAE